MQIQGKRRVVLYLTWSLHC